MRVYLQPTGLYSRAMIRVANALTRYAPSRVQIAEREQDADLVILHVIGDAISAAERILSERRRYAVIQYCVNPCREEADCHFLWRNADLVWSYYDLSPFARADGFQFYHAPLGIDDAFLPQPYWQRFREQLVITSGYVDGERAEAISEVWQAAEIAGVEAIHVGPSRVEGMRAQPAKWNARHGLTDQELAALYGRVAWVSGLRHVEGFELPCVEGLVMGARPIMFRQPAIEHWYGDFAEYVEDRSGQPLVDDLVRLFTGPYRAVGLEEQEQAVARFDWQMICAGFWQRVIAAMECAA